MSMQTQGQMLRCVAYGCCGASLLLLMSWGFSSPVENKGLILEEEQSQFSENKLLLVTAELLHGRLDKVCAKYDLNVFYNGGLRLVGQRQGVQVKHFASRGIAEWGINERDSASVYFSIGASTIKPAQSVNKVNINKQEVFLSIRLGTVGDLNAAISPRVKIGISEFIKEIGITRLPEEEEPASEKR